MNEFQKLLASNTELKAKIEAMNKDPKATAADFIALAKEYGVELTEAGFQQAPAGGEVSDSELENVAGGGTCYCAWGGGKADETHDTCACVVFGCGTSDKTDSLCICPTTGIGY